MLNWDECSDIFVWEGGFLDFYVYGTDRSDWQELLTFLRTSPISLTLRSGGTTGSLPEDVSVLFERWQHDMSVLDIHWQGLRIVTDFYDEAQMEFGVDPREVRGEAEFRHLVAFFHNVAKLVDKPVVLPRYNEPERPIIRIGPGQDVAELSA